MLSLAPPPPVVIGERAPVTLAGEPGLYGLVPWRLTPRHVDRYFSGPGKRAGATVRQKLNRIDGYFAFLEQRYGGEIARRFGCAVESPVDPFNRPAHRGDFGLRVPPSRRALREFFAAWRADLPGARKELVACRDYAMAKIAYITGVRATQLCGMRIKDLHWESGQFGRFLVRGKGARGSGPRLREAQKILGHDWTTTTVRYILSAQGDPERASLEAAGRAMQRLAVDTGRLR